MINPSAISKTVLRGLKQKIFGKSHYGNKQWDQADNEWYQKLHDQRKTHHKKFIEYLKKKNNVKTILEVGCGTGIYPIQHNELFVEKDYTGIDFSKPNIEFCKTKSNFEFINGDFLKMDLPNTYDLVFSHAVIDHVYDIDEFLKRVVMTCKKYAYISAYRGYFPTLEHHEMNWRDDDNCYYNNLSVKQTEDTLKKLGLKEDEFIISKQENLTNNSIKYEETIIEITKRNEN